MSVRERGADPRTYRPAAGQIPTSPGVYRFLGVGGRVLYVGKAKNLRQRLSNYFAPLPTLHERTRRMVTTAVDLQWTVVGSDLEALQLEYGWIKEFDPPFNVMFKDDKSYPSLAITLEAAVPRVFVTRNRGIRGAKYFGPFAKARALHETVDALLKVFPMRSCSDGVFRRAQAQGRPCLLGDIGKCAAPCVGRVTPAQHKAIALDFAAFMGGADTRFIAETRERMLAASDAMEFEQAARYRDQVEYMEATLARNDIVLPDDTDADFFGIVEDALQAAVQQFVVRGGRVRGVHAAVVEKELDISLAALVGATLTEAYGSGDRVPPRRIYVPALPAEADTLAQWLTGLRPDAAAVRISVAKRGDKAALAQTAALNAEHALILHKSKRATDFAARSAALAELQQSLGLADAPLRIECYDISHLGGTNIVASMVVFEDGLPRKDQYRSFTIAEARDDTDAMHQVLARRLARLDDDTAPLDEDGARRRFAYRPQLIVVDGGAPQVAAAARAMSEAGVEITGPRAIGLVGIAKRLEELWLPDDDYPAILPRGSEALYLIQRVRDEAHRFAITHQRKRRKRDIASVLAQVPGLGPARVKELLRHFGSARAVRAASAEELTAVRGIGPSVAEAIIAVLAESAARDPDDSTAA